MVHPAATYFRHAIHLKPAWRARGSHGLAVGLSPETIYGVRAAWIQWAGDRAGIGRGRGGSLAILWSGGCCRVFVDPSGSHCSGDHTGYPTALLVFGDRQL